MEAVLEKSAFIQCDWEKSTDGAESSDFFFGRRSHTDKNDFYKARVTPTGDVVLEKTDEDHSIEIHGNSAIVHFPDFETKFVAPTACISNPYAKTSLKSLDVNNTGNMIAFTDAAGHFSVLRSKDATELRVMEGHVMDVYQCRFFPSGLVLLSAGMDLTVRVWSVELGECVRKFAGHTQAVTGVAIIDVGREVLSCSKDGSAIKWSCPEDREVKRWEFHSGPCNCICTGADHISTLFAVACEGKKVFIVDSNGDIMSTFSTTDVSNAVAFDNFSDKQTLYVGDEAGGVLAIDVRKKEEVFKLKTARRSVTRIVSHREGILVAYGDGTVAMYRRDFSVDHPIVEFSGSDIDPIYDIAVVGDTLYTASRDNTIRQYTIPSS